jgi:hypothetical protein
MTLSTSLSTPRNFLPDPALIGTEHSWTYSYTMNISDLSGLGVLAAVPVPVSGVFADRGMEDVEIGGEIMSAWRIDNNYTIEWSATAGLGPFTEDVTAEASAWWVEGLGLVAETHTNVVTGEVLLDKTLSEWAGL